MAVEPRGRGERVRPSRPVRRASRGPAGSRINVQEDALDAVRQVGSYWRCVSFCQEQDT
jgi:hypothetical protein